ncbi:hypothetical protein XAC3810_770080 [Xanthomonas citri pv. citri]|uniref:Uncharacterized protein n=1 Tax=Xanthomonas citri pv. citri TaxID=611301 RepID=A0A0U5FJD4_XANCI|nr:hypothetical protein XAC908_1090042 [Xanthomonas citri pv. citri]CEE39952.1 hypothetical protein XAC3824_920082 [Xanthomonas citri pv. citri]CEE40006.1 hypothetical protein XAC9322_740083 [Xanthomonas citri pv. citri]CEE41449.1 hypothetical protein XAC1083_770062 [Xanthomonas citri pv. citri]CEE47915.1 hypothetical protein XAC3810_770080 [Xanthomonas citri pv. citri]
MGVGTLSRRDIVLLYGGEGAPQGRMRVRAKHRVNRHLEWRCPVASPQPISRQERGFEFPSPLGRRCPAGADEGADETSG